MDEEILDRAASATKVGKKLYPSSSVGEQPWRVRHRGPEGRRGFGTNLKGSLGAQPARDIGEGTSAGVERGKV